MRRERARDVIQRSKRKLPEIKLFLRLYVASNIRLYVAKGEKFLAARNDKGGPIQHTTR